MANIEPGIIRFEKYEVEEIQFKLNSAYEEEEVDIDIKMEVEVTSDDNEHMRIRLIIHIFDEAIKNRYPFEMKVVVVGYFSIGVEKDNDIAHYQANAIAILYPYIRAIVSTYTASANVTPLILPTVNEMCIRDRDYTGLCKGGCFRQRYHCKEPPFHQALPAGAGAFGGLSDHCHETVWGWEIPGIL